MQTERKSLYWPQHCTEPTGDERRLPVCSLANYSFTGRLNIFPQCKQATDRLISLSSPDSEKLRATEHIPVTPSHRWFPRQHNIRCPRTHMGTITAPASVSSSASGFRCNEFQRQIFPSFNQVDMELRVRFSSIISSSTNDFVLYYIFCAIKHYLYHNYKATTSITTFIYLKF